jgi:hypothetical protein
MSRRRRMCRACGAALPIQSVSYQIYCSVTCRNAARYRRIHPTKIRRCVVCASEFSSPKRKTTCSVLCRQIIRRQTANRWYARHGQERKTERRECLICRKEFFVMRSDPRPGRTQTKNGRRTCSRECALILRARHNKMASKRWHDRLRCNPELAFRKREQNRLRAKEKYRNNAEHRERLAAKSRQQRSILRALRDLGWIKNGELVPSS